MTKPLIFILVIGLTLGLCTCGAVLGVKNTCVVQTNAIQAQYEGNKVSLAGYTNKIMDMVQVPAMAKDHIKEVAQAAIQGRYGADGAKQVFLMVKEQNATVDPGLYRSLMAAMEAGRNGFDADQKSLLDKCRVHNTYVESAPQSFFVGFLGYPHADLADKCKPVTTEQTEQDFRNHTTGPLKIN
jgi:hypothetical protein